MILGHDVDLAKLDLEQGELSRCRWGFLLLAAGMLLQILLELVPLLWATPESLQAPRNPSLIDHAMSIGAILIGFIPGAAFLFHGGRTPRWRHAAGWLIVAGLADIVILIGMASVMPAGAPREPSSLAIRVLVEASVVLSWLEFWWIAVVVAEFSLACRTVRVVEQTEQLGFCILVGGAIAVTYAAWTLPVAPRPDQVDEMTAILAIALLLANLVCLFWILWLLAQSVTVAPFARCPLRAGKTHAQRTLDR